VPPSPHASAPGAARCRAPPALPAASAPAARPRPAGAFAFGYHLGVINGPLESIASELAFAGNKALEGLVGGRWGWWVAGGWLEGLVGGCWAGGWRPPAAGPAPPGSGACLAGSAAGRCQAAPGTSAPPIPPPPPPPPQVVSSVLAGATAGSLGGAGVADRLGRKRGLALCAAPMLVGPLLSAASTSINGMVLGRWATAAARCPLPAACCPLPAACCLLVKRPTGSRSTAQHRSSHRP
jgi:hypothetical protein